MSHSPQRGRVRLRSGALWDLMDRRSISQNELARAAGTTSGYLSLLASGKRSPSPAMRRRPAACFGRPILRRPLRGGVRP